MFFLVIYGLYFSNNVCWRKITLLQNELFCCHAFICSTLLSIGIYKDIPFLGGEELFRTFMNVFESLRTNHVDLNEKEMQNNEKYIVAIIIFITIVLILLSSFMAY